MITDAADIRSRAAEGLAALNAVTRAAREPIDAHCADRRSRCRRLVRPGCGATKRAELRVVMIFDVWRPELSEKEQNLVGAMLEVSD